MRRGQKLRRDRIEMVAREMIQPFTARQLADAVNSAYLDGATTCQCAIVLRNIAYIDGKINDIALWRLL